jgi:hypothetical protein
MVKIPLPHNYSGWVKSAVFIVALILTVVIVGRSNFLEGLSKLWNVGAGTESTTPATLQLAKLTLHYDFTTAPVDGYVRIYRSQDGLLVSDRSPIDLTTTGGELILRDIELAARTQYTVILGGQGAEEAALYFVTSSAKTDAYDFTFGSIKARGGTADLNGDGSVNTLDYQLFLEMWQAALGDGSSQPLST